VASERLALTASGQVPRSTPRHVAMSWARRLKRVFGIEIEGCARCGAKLAIIASIEEPEVIARILAHLEQTDPDQFQPELPLGARAWRYPTGREIAPAQGVVADLIGLDHGDCKQRFALGRRQQFPSRHGLPCRCLGRLVWAITKDSCQSF
jgi:hypothetical protein